MKTAHETTPVPMDVNAMSKVQKVAALLIILGPEAAAQFLKQLDEAELEAVTSEMAKITVVTQEMRTRLLEEFTSIAVEAGSSALGGLNFARSSLEKSFGPSRALSIINRVAPASTPPGAMQQLMEMDARQIAHLLRTEQPQTIALVTSYLSPDKASALLTHLDNNLRDRVVERLATMAQTPIEVVERVVELLNRRAGSRSATVTHQSGGLKSAADVLNSMDRTLSKAVLASLEERNPELGAAIRQKMFTFEDLVSLDTNVLQRIMREVEMRDLAVALKTASEKVKSALFACISKRAAETVNEEIEFMGPLRLRDVEAAQARIIEVVRRLESEGEIDLSEVGRPSDELVV